MAEEFGKELEFGVCYKSTLSRNSGSVFLIFSKTTVSYPNILYEAFILCGNISEKKVFTFNQRDYFASTLVRIDLEE